MKRFLLQMAGTSGAGKSTLARAIANRLGIMVIDLDVVKSAALDAGASWDMAGRVGYEASRAVAQSILEQGSSVILDSPCRFQQIVDEGIGIADETQAVYAFIECILQDEAVLQDRMNQRHRHRSQRIAFDVPPPDAPTDAMQNSDGDIEILQTIYPSSHWIQIDTSQPLEVCIQQAIDYLNTICK